MKSRAVVVKRNPASRSKFSINKEAIPQIIRYFAIGGYVFVQDAVTFQLLIKAGVFRPLATTISFVLAVAIHFVLNKFFNFKSFQRSTLGQLRTYVVVVTFSWLLTILIIEVGVRGFALLPLTAKLIAILVNLPVGYFGHRYLTFGGGVRTVLRRCQKSFLKG